MRASGCARAMGSKAAGADPPAPAEFEIARGLPVGRHPLLAVFPGLDRLPLASKLAEDPAERAQLFAETSIEVVDQDMWMYVAPQAMPPFARRRGWKPVITPEHDCVVVGVGHLRESAAMILYLDIFHELRHVVQRRHGANLWEPGVSYVERATEIDAYRLVIAEAQRLGVEASYLREYLKVEWITQAEHLQLLQAVGVPPPAPTRKGARR